MTAVFSAGRHSLAMTLANGAAVQRLRIERKKDSAADYLATLRRLGLDLGESRPTPRSLAVQAMNFLKARRLLDAARNCGEVILPANARVAGLNVGGGSITTGTTNPPVEPPGAGPDPGGIQVPLPGPTPTPSASPTASPGPSPTPSIAPTPAPTPTPSPSLGPPPPTTTQPPASPVK
jgi:hypothetical protein